MADKSILGLTKLNQQLKKLASIKGSKAIVAAGETLMRYSQINSPVLSGNLRASPTVVETGDNQAEMSFNTDYAWYQEEGTQDFEGRHYVQRASDEHEAEIVDAARKQIQKEIKDVI